MDIDSYQQCPCHSEKKIKFCCGKGIVGDLNQILAKNRSGQSASALEQIERTIKKTGPKDCLLTLQTHILISIGELEKAKQSNELFLTQNPNHPTGLHHLALILLSEGKTHQAIETLQDAMDAITGNEIPISIANAFRILGLALLNSGDPIAAQAHLRFAMALKGEADPEVDQLIARIYQSPEMPMSLKQEFQIAPVPEGVEWESKYVNVHRALDRGQFRKALVFLNRLNESNPDLAIIGRGIAVVSSFLGLGDDNVAAWRRYSGMPDVSPLEAVEAELIAQTYDRRPESSVNPIVRLTYELSESEGAFELALSSPRLAASPALESDPFQEGPAPRLFFSILDREKCRSADELTIDTAPAIIGELICYGKQTDRPARLELVALRNSSFETVTQFITDRFSDFISGDPSETQLSQSSELDELFDWRWELPDDTTREQHSELIELKRQSVLRNQWMKIKRGCLNDRSPEEVSSDPKMQIRLQALIHELENSAAALLFDDELAAELREKLGIKPIETIDISESGSARSPIRQQYIQWDKLSDEQLVVLRNQALTISNFRVLIKIIPEILNRPDLTLVPRDLSYSMMAQMTQNVDQALEYLDLARAEAIKADRPIGIYLVQEFELRLSRGLTEKLADLLQTIQKSHLDDPEVEYRLSRVLNQYGIGPHQAEPEGQQPGEPHQAPETDSRQSGGVWTPDQGASPSPPETTENSGGSGLWVPD